MANEQNNDMQRLQQEAIRRVQEMQSRAQQSLNSTTRENNMDSSYQNSSPPHAGSPAHHEPFRQEQAHHDPAPQLNLSGMRPMPDMNHQMNPVTNIFDKLLQDHERTLILILLLILVDEKADTELIFALMYLIL